MAVFVSRNEYSDRLLVEYSYRFCILHYELGLNGLCRWEGIKPQSYCVE